MIPESSRGNKIFCTGGKDIPDSGKSVFVSGLAGFHQKTARLAVEEI